MYTCLQGGRGVYRDLEGLRGFTVIYRVYGDLHGFAGT